MTIEIGWAYTRRCIVDTPLLEISVELISILGTCRKSANHIHRFIKKQGIRSKFFCIDPAEEKCLRISVDFGHATEENLYMPGICHKYGTCPKRRACL